MSNINKQALREAAEKATPGNWRRASTRFNGITAQGVYPPCGKEEILASTAEKRDAEFIAAANPSTVLALLDELEKWQQESSAWQAVAEKQLALVADAEKLISELEDESEERRQFILNGVEMGFIRLPDKDTRDPATETYERCLNGIQYMPCPKCNDTGMMDSGGTQPCGEPIEIECDCRQQDAKTAELVAAGIITKIGG